MTCVNSMTPKVTSKFSSPQGGEPRTEYKGVRFVPEEENVIVQYEDSYNENDVWYTVSPEKNPICEVVSDFTFSFYDGDFFRIRMMKLNIS